ncbi:MAG: site-specific DNA-methyltransferase, partial [Bacteroidaceae bacterium]|nr:site-specific DNA-methyltransferase [Bacteroidaceae bacterium]
QFFLKCAKNIILSIIDINYYTGKKFPSTVALNKLYYFMPYMKNKGIRDLYQIKVARVGTKKEVHPECDDNDFRLVFEIEYVKQLFNDYKIVDLQIWHTFTDTTIGALKKLI